MSPRNFLRVYTTISEQFAIVVVGVSLSLRVVTILNISDGSGKTLQDGSLSKLEAERS